MKFLLIVLILTSCSEGSHLKLQTVDSKLKSIVQASMKYYQQKGHISAKKTVVYQLFCKNQKLAKVQLDDLKIYQSKLFDESFFNITSKTVVSGAKSKLSSVTYSYKGEKTEKYFLYEKIQLMNKKEYRILIWLDKAVWEEKLKDELGVPETDRSIHLICRSISLTISNLELKLPKISSGKFLDM